MLFNFKKNKKSQIFLQEKKSIFDEWAKTRTAEGFGFVIDRLPNPDIILRKTGKGIGVLRTLTNHYQVGTCIDSRKSGTKSKVWQLKENNCNKEHFKFYDEIFKIINTDKLIDDVLDTPLYGYNPIEIIWEKCGNYIIPKNITAKPQEWFYFNSDGEFFFKDRTMGGKRQIDLNGYKFLLPRNKADFLNPYGQAVLSRCFWNVAFINGGMEFWVKFTEKLGMPYIFGKYDRSMTDKEQNEMLTALSNLIQDAVAVIPSDGSIEIMQTGSSTNTDIYNSLIDKCENNIAKAILGQTLTTDIGSAGSYAASQTHACVRADIVNSDSKLVEKTINRLIVIINEINFNDENVPVFEFIEENSELQKAERDTKIKSLGFDFSEEYIIKTYGYEKGDIIPSEKADCEQRLKAGNVEFSAVTPFIASNQGQQGFSFQDSENFETLENLENISGLKNIIEPQLTTIIDFFDTTRNAEETIEKLAELYPELNNEELEKTLAKVIFIAELMGRNSVARS